MNRRTFLGALACLPAAPALPLKELLAEESVLDCGPVPFSIPVFINEAYQPGWNQYPTPLQALDWEWEVQRATYAPPEGPFVWRG